MTAPRCCSLAFALVWLMVQSAAAQEVERTDLEAAYLEHRAAERWPEAIAAAKALAQSAEEHTGKDSLGTAQAVAQLAETEYLAGELTGAEADYLRAITIIESRLGSLNGRLLGPLRGLGQIYLQRGERELAVVVLDRALQVSRRHEGLFNTGQLTMLYQLSDALTDLGQLERAEQQLVYAVRVAEQSYGADDPRTAEPLSRLARWCSRVAAYNRSRNLYLQAISAIEKSGGPDDLALVGPLRGLANNAMYAFVVGDPNPSTPVDPVVPGHSFEPTQIDPRPGNRRRLDKESERALLRALEIQQDNPAADPLTRAATLIQIGDWFLLKGDYATSRQYYAQAWPVVADRTDVEAESRDLVVSYPVQLYFVPPTGSKRSAEYPEGEAVEHFVLVEFTVTPEGHTADLTVVDSDASRRQVKQTLDALRTAQYRPRFEEGNPVVTERVRHRQVFRERRDNPDAESPS